MTMTDPIADMLTRLRNGNTAYHDTVAMPHSKIKVGIAEILKAQGYIAGWSVDRRRGRTDADDRPEVRAEPGALDRGCPARVQARPSRVREEHGAAQGARRPGRRDHLDLVRSADRPRGRKEAGRRGSPRLRLVAGKETEQCHESGVCPSPSPPA